MGWILVAMSVVFNCIAELCGESRVQNAHEAVGWFIPLIVGCFMLISDQISKGNRRG